MNIYHIYRRLIGGFHDFFLWKATVQILGTCEKTIFLEPVFVGTPCKGVLKFSSKYSIVTVYTE